MKRVAIIPARGGSKRLHRKNVLSILGRPMLAYPIQTALKSQMFDRVIVSTEDEKIERAALKAGAEVVRRPEALARDHAKVVQVCEHALDVLRDKDIQPEYFCCIYATAIFITPEDISNSFKIFEDDPKPDVVMGVSEFNMHPVQALQERDAFLMPKWPEFLGMQSQFYPRLVASNGTLYWAQTSNFRRNLSFYSSRLKAFSIPKHRAIDINTEEDLELAKLLAEKAINKRM